jgi:hypothetical protein
MALIWLLAIILVDPRGEFPLIDDWAYRWSVDQLVVHGRFALSDWSATNLAGHVLWGALFAKLFGTGFETLRASTLMLGFVGGVALYVWLRVVHVRPAHALVGALCLLLNPIYLALSFTFMTDVPYAALQIAAMALLTTGLAGSGTIALASGWALALFALSIRQVGIAIPSGYGAALLWRDGLRARSLTLAIAPVLGFWLAQKAYERWLAATGRLPAQFGFNAEEIASRLAEPLSVILVQAGNAIIYLFMYGGLFVLPVALLVMRSALAPLPLRAKLVLRWAIPAVSCLIAAVITAIDGPMPIWGGILSKWGVGGHLGLPEAPIALRILITVASALGGTLGCAILLVRLWQLVSGQYSRAAAGTIAACFVVGGLLFAPLLLIPARFDRYLLPILPCLIVALLARPDAIGQMAPADPRGGRRRLLLASLALVAFAFFGATGSRDFLSEERARLAALRQALALGYPRENIDAGWILNGWHMYGEVGARRNIRALASWYGDPILRVTYRHSYGYEIIARVRVDRVQPWARWMDTPILIERRMPGFGAFIGPPSYDPAVGPEFGYPHE